MIPDWSFLIAIITIITIFIMIRILSQTLQLVDCFIMCIGFLNILEILFYNLPLKFIQITEFIYYFRICRDFIIYCLFDFQIQFRRCFRMLTMRTLLIIHNAFEVQLRHIIAFKLVNVNVVQGGQSHVTWSKRGGFGILPFQPFQLQFERVVFLFVSLQQFAFFFHFGVFVDDQLNFIFLGGPDVFHIGLLLLDHCILFLRVVMLFLQLG